MSYAAPVHALPPILIAEDNDDDFVLFRIAARAAAIENPLLRFRDGSELVRFVETSALDPEKFHGGPLLLFVDLSMPIMNGFEVLEWLRSRQASGFMPVVLTGTRREEDLKRAYSLGAQECLVKPISPMVLAALAVRATQAA